MEIKNQFPSTIVQTYDGSAPYVSSVNGGKGRLKYLSARNNIRTVRTPGQFKAYPVVIRQTDISCRDILTQKHSYQSIQNCMLEGDILGHMATNMTVDPTSLIQKVPWDSDLATAASNRAFAAAVKPDFDLGVNLGEFRETLKSLADPLGALRKYISDYNKLSRTRVPGVSVKNTVRNGERVRPFDMLAGSWLEWRFGIRPIIQTIESLIELANKQINAWSGKMLRKQGKLKSSGVKLAFGVQTPAYITCRAHAELAYRLKYVAKLYFTEDLPTDWQHQAGIALDQMPSVAWELVPVSFIIDRYIRIGDWIEAINFYADRKRTVKGMVISRKLTIEGKGYLDSVKLANAVSMSVITPPDMIIQVQELDRRVVSTPSVSIFPPWSPVSKSLQQALDEISLLWQRMPKLRR